MNGTLGGLFVPTDETTTSRARESTMPFSDAFEDAALKILIAFLYARFAFVFAGFD